MIDMRRSFFIVGKTLNSEFMVQVSDTTMYNRTTKARTKFKCVFLNFDFLNFDFIS
jgi:hypothetical protein